MAPDGSASGLLDGMLFALDVLPMEPVEGVSFLLGDFREQDIFDKLVDQIGNKSVDVVVSDMAPNLSGIPEVDAARMFHLIELAVEFCQLHLKKEGALVVKAFHGSGYDQIVKLFKNSFKLVKPFKPKASRAKSSENFLIGIGIK
jgi:23S rRNA (uridine2552-2'-O)-methyltransferase